MPEETILVHDFSHGGEPDYVGKHQLSLLYGALPKKLTWSRLLSYELHDWAVGKGWESGI